jgi:hypothetical protein
MEMIGRLAAQPEVHRVCHPALVVCGLRMAADS